MQASSAATAGQYCHSRSWRESRRHVFWNEGLRYRENPHWYVEKDSFWLALTQTKLYDLAVTDTSVCLAVLRCTQNAWRGSWVYWSNARQRTLNCGLQVRMVGHSLFNTYFPTLIAQKDPMSTAHKGTYLLNYLFAKERDGFGGFEGWKISRFPFRLFWRPAPTPFASLVSCAWPARALLQIFTLSVQFRLFSLHVWHFPCSLPPRRGFPSFSKGSAVRLPPPRAS